MHFTTDHTHALYFHFVYSADLFCSPVDNNILSLSLSLINWVGQFSSATELKLIPNNQEEKRMAYDRKIAIFLYTTNYKCRNIFIQRAHAHAHPDPHTNHHTFIHILSNFIWVFYFSGAASHTHNPQQYHLA